VVSEISKLKEIEKGELNLGRINFNTLQAPIPSFTRPSRFVKYGKKTGKQRVRYYLIKENKFLYLRKLTDKQPVLKKSMDLIEATTLFETSVLALNNIYIFHIV
jgi:hypothetical protein